MVRRITPRICPLISSPFCLCMKPVNTCESLLPLPYRDSCPPVINSRKQGHNFRNFKKHMIVLPLETPHGDRALVKAADSASASISLGTLCIRNLHSCSLFVQAMREEAILWFTHGAQLRPLAVENAIAYCRFNGPPSPTNLLVLSEKKKWLEKGQSN